MVHPGYGGPEFSDEFEGDAVTKPTSGSRTSKAKATTAAAPSPTEIVTEFLERMHKLDIDGAVELLHEDVVYQNVSTPAFRGKAKTARALHSFNKMWTGFHAENHRIAADGNTVLTERTDTIEIGAYSASFWVCGTFEVKDGKIILWRDYFDWANIVAGSIKGAGRTLAGLITRRKA